MTCYLSKILVVKLLGYFLGNSKPSGIEFAEFLSSSTQRQ